MEWASESTSLDPPSSTDVIELKVPLIRRILKGRGYTPRLRWFLIGMVLTIALYTTLIYYIEDIVDYTGGNTAPIPMPTESIRLTY